MARIVLLSLFVLLCSCNSRPLQVKSELKFGHYVISPPINYFYFQKKFPDKLSDKNDYFLVTFWKDPPDTSKKDLIDLSIFFNFAVIAKNFETFDDFYNNAKSLGFNYYDLPSEAKGLKNIDKWSCKQTEDGVYGIECVSIRDHIITIGLYGKEKATVLSQLPLLQKMLYSFQLRDGA